MSTKELPTARINLKAVSLGLLVYLGGSMVIGALMGVMASIFLPAYIQAEFIPDSALPVILTITSLGLIFLAGFVTGRIAKEGEMVHGLVVGVVGLVLGFVFKSVSLGWVTAISLVLILPAAVWGAVVGRNTRAQ